MKAHFFFLFFFKAAYVCWNPSQLQALGGCAHGLEKKAVSYRAEHQQSSSCNNVFTAVCGGSRALLSGFFRCFAASRVQFTDDESENCDVIIILKMGTAIFTPTLDGDLNPSHASLR